MSRLLAGAAVAMVVITACSTGRQQSESAVAFAKLDTIRGAVSLVENDPAAELILSLDPDSVPIALAGSRVAPLRHLRKLDVMVAGRFTGQRSLTASPRGARVFEADTFVVRGMDGTPAVDGIIAMQNSRYFVLANGRRLPVEYMPKALQGKLGARVFLAGPLEAPLIFYGVILEKP